MANLTLSASSRTLEVLGRPQEALAAGSVRAPVLQLSPEGGDLRGQLAQFQL